MDKRVLLPNHIAIGRDRRSYNHSRISSGRPLELQDKTIELQQCAINVYLVDVHNVLYVAITVGKYCVNGGGRILR